MSILSYIDVENDKSKIKAIFTIKDDMFSMHSDKCPGQNEFNPGFFQRFWSVCSFDIFHECCMWLNNN